MNDLSHIIESDQTAGTIAGASFYYAEAAYIPDAMGDGVLIKDRSDQGELKGIEELVQREGLPRSHVKHIEQLNRSIDQFIGMLRQYESSGNYDTFTQWCKTNGYGTPPRPNKVAASSQPEEAVAWTPGDRNNPLIGTNKYLDDRIRQIAANYSLSRDEAVEMVITHELFHNVQNNSVKSKGYAHTEQDCEEKMYQFFTEKARAAKTPQEKAKYEKIAKTAGQRAIAWQKARGRNNYKGKNNYQNNSEQNSNRQYYNIPSRGRRSYSLRGDYTVNNKNRDQSIRQKYASDQRYTNNKNYKSNQKYSNNLRDYSTTHKKSYYSSGTNKR